MQVFEEENANLFVILFIKDLLFAQGCGRMFEVGRLLRQPCRCPRRYNNFFWNMQGFEEKKFGPNEKMSYFCCV